MTFTFILIITCFISLWHKEKKNEIKSNLYQADPILGAVERKNFIH